MKTYRTTAPGNKKAAERGSVLVVGILVMVTMLIIAIPFLFRLSAQSRTTEKGYRSEAAFHLAEAGVEKTLWRINEPFIDPANTDPEPIQWTTDGTNQLGAINDLKTPDNKVVGDIAIIQGPPTATEPALMTLTSTGRVPFIAAATVDRTVRVNLERYYDSAFSMGFFVDEFFYIHNGFDLDSYDSSKGTYGATLPDGTVNAEGSTIFGTNGYVGAAKPNDPGEASWVIDAGGGSSHIWGTIAAGGNDAELHATDPANPAPDPSILDEVVNVDKDTVFQDATQPPRTIMNQRYDLNSVDVFDLPPKDFLGAQQNVADWFSGYSETTPAGSSYYAHQFERSPYLTEVEASYQKGSYTVPAGSTATFNPANSGVYTSFSLGTDKAGANLNIDGGNVTIYVTEYADNPNAVARLLMGPNSNINIADGSSLTLILGSTSFVVGKAFTINQTSGTPADCIILGTDQFAFPANRDRDTLPKKMDQIDDIPGLMYFEQGTGSDAGEIYAAIYTPRAHIATGQGQNHLSVYGSMTSASMAFKCQVDFHYDKALGDLNIVTGGFKYWRVTSWQELLGQN